MVFYVIKKSKKIVLLILNSFLFSIIYLLLPFNYIFAQDLDAPFIKPLDGKITVSFRQEYIDIEKNIERKHTGIDIAGEVNEPVYAAGNGQISYCGFSPIGGLTLVIRHNNKIKTTYLNLASVFVSPGDIVSQGQRIASIGSNDDPSSSECHLHFGIIYDDFYLDPEDVLGIDYSNISKFLILKYCEYDFIIR